MGRAICLFLTGIVETDRVDDCIGVMFSAPSIVD